MFILGKMTGSCSEKGNNNITIRKIWLRSWKKALDQVLVVMSDLKKSVTEL